MTSNKAEARVAICVVCVRARRANRATQLIGSSTRWFHGVCHIQGTDITIGQDCMAAWNGTDSSVRQSRIRSQWENRFLYISLTFYFLFFSNN